MCRNTKLDDYRMMNLLLVIVRSIKFLQHKITDS